MRKVYLNKTGTNDCISVFVQDAEVLSAGTTIHSMSLRDKNEEYQRYADDYDIHFIFDDDIPAPAFYTVPQVDIMAKDSKGGFIGTVGQQSDLESDAPICYINNQQECFLIAKTGKEFIMPASIVNKWASRMITKRCLAR